MLPDFIRRPGIALQFLHRPCIPDLRVCRGPQRGITIYAYANNHYAGHAPDTVKLFRGLWNNKK